MMRRGWRRRWSKLENQAGATVEFLLALLLGVLVSSFFLFVCVGVCGVWCGVSSD